MGGPSHYESSPGGKFERKLAGQAGQGAPH